MSAPPPGAASAPIRGYDARLLVRGDGPPLVLVPGLDGTGLLFYRQVPRLARRFRVATYRLRDEATSMAQLVDDLVGVLDAVAPDGAPAIVIGESFGGALGLSLALAHPARVRALVVLNTFPHFAPQWRLRLGRHALRAVPWGMMALVRRLTAFRLHSRHTHRREIQRFLALTAATTRRGYLGRLAILREYDLRDRLAAIRTPTLLLAADQDRLVPAVAQAEVMAARLPDATIVRLEGHGHVCLIAPGVALDRLLLRWRPGLARPARPRA